MLFGLKRALLAFCLGTVCSLAAAAPDAARELVFGIYPYLSPSRIVEQFAPLNDYLARALGRPVALRSAPNFLKFIERTRAGEYDIVFTAPHMGRLAEKRDGYLPVAQTGYQIVIVALVKQDSPLRSLADMKGHSLAVGAQLSMTYQIVDHTLGKSGLALGRDVRFVDTASFSNVIEAVMRNEADAGATGTLLWDTAPPAQHAALREIFRSQPVPGFLVLAHPRIGTDTLRRITQALFDFEQTPAGRAFFASSQQLGFRPLDAATMQRIDPYTAVFDTALPQPPR
jgi:phosphonate transport system substrate-binding protein